MFGNLFDFFKSLFVKKSRLIVYGDIHGCLDKLLELRQKIGVTEEDIEVCAGDMINKGEKSKETITFLRENGILAVLGNHEDKIVRYINYGVKNPQKKNPMKLEEKDRAFINSLSAKDICYLEELPVFLKFGVFTIVHGGLQNYMDLKNLPKRDRSKIVRMRYLDRDKEFVTKEEETKDSIFWGDVYNGKNGFVIFGHKPVKKPLVKEHCLGIDTGCVYGRELSAVVIEDTERVKYDIVQV